MIKACVPQDLCVRCGALCLADAGVLQSGSVCALHPMRKKKSPFHIRLLENSRLLESIELD